MVDASRARVPGDEHDSPAEKTKEPAYEPLETSIDFQNFINATSIPTIFLDRALRVRFSTVHAQEFFNLQPVHIGCRLSDVTSSIIDDRMLSDATQVLEQSQPVEREVLTREGRACLMRILPYRTPDHRIEGVVITFVDVTTLRRAEADVLIGEQRLRQFIDSAEDALEERVGERTSELQYEQKRVRGLLRALVTSQELQRSRIARDLHDQLGQQLTALRLTLERGLQNLAAGRDPEQELGRALALTSELNDEIDFLAWELRPAALDDHGLSAALPRFLHDWSTHYGIQAEFRLAGFVAGHLSKEVEVTYYRIAQEALNNVLKHAHAGRVDVLLQSSDGRVTLEVADDGVGFDTSADAPAPDGFGLLGMKERAALFGATLDLQSTPGQGTKVCLRSPRLFTDSEDARESPEPM